MLTICHVTMSKGWTGGTYQAFLQTKGVSSLGYRSFICCAQGSILEERCLKENVEYYTIPSNSQIDRVTRGVAKFLRIIKKNNVDVVHAHHPRAHGMGLIAAVLGITNSLVVTRRIMRPPGKNILGKIKYLNRNIDFYIAVSESVKRVLVGYGVGEEKIKVIYSAFDSIRLPKSDMYIRKRKELGIIPGTFIIGMVGNPSPIKGHNSILKAFKEVLKRFPRTVLLNVGVSEDDYPYRIATQLGIEKSIKFLGFRNDVVDIMAAMDIIVFPSLSEGMGTALIESQCVGIPSICSRVGGMPEIIEDGVNGMLVPPADPKAQFKAITTLIKDQSLRTSMGKRARKQSRKFYINTISGQLGSLYKEVIERK